jgi:4-hydroxybenzoyl-CoA reductase subunit beta
VLRLPPLEVARPDSLAAALDLLGRPGARALAGGTDLLPALKNRRQEARLLVLLEDLPELAGVELRPGELILGAALRLADLAAHPLVLQTVPVLAQAAARAASPQIRNRGTLGGNLCLATRCRYLDRPELGRRAIGGCLRWQGERCHVVPGGRRCVAALSSDLVPVLVALEASLEVAGPGGERRLALARLYQADGRDHLALGPGELIRAVRLPLPGPTSRLAYRKWARRQSIDFPLVSAAVRLEIEEGRMLGGMVVVGVLGPRPRVVSLEEFRGHPADLRLARQIGERVKATCKPLPNVPYDPDYRRHRLGIEVQRAVASLVEAP